MNYLINLIWQNMAEKNLEFIVLWMHKRGVIMIKKLYFHLLNLLRVNFCFLDVFS